MATYYFRNVGTAWNDTSSWSTTSSSGISAGTTPTSLDAVIFDSGSASACPVSTTNGVCLSLLTTGWTGTMTLNVPVRVSGNITLGSTTSFSGSSYLGAIATGTITATGVVIPYLMVGTGVAMTLTLGSNLTVTTFQLADVTNAVTYTINGNTMNISGDIIYQSFQTGAIQAGTTIFNLNGTSNVGNIVPNNFTFNNPIVINTSGIITFGAGFVFGGTSFTYTSGTVDMTTNSCYFRLSSTSTFNSGPIVFSTFEIINNPTVTLTSNVIAQTFYVRHTGTFTTTINGAFKIYVGIPDGSLGNLLCLPAGSSVVTGTATIEFTGKGGVGTWTYDQSGNYGGAFRQMNWNINITINTGGTLYILDKLNTAANYYYTIIGGSKTFTYTAGNVITKTLNNLPNIGLSFKGGTLQVATGHVLIGLNKIAFGRIILAGGGTYTMDEFPCGNPNIITQMTSTTTANYTVTLTSTKNRNERIANYIRVKNCSFAAANRNQVLVTHPKGNLGSNIGIRFYDVSGHGLPKNIVSVQQKYKIGNELSQGAVGLAEDPIFSSF